MSNEDRIVWLTQLTQHSDREAAWLSDKSNGYH